MNVIKTPLLHMQVFSKHCFPGFFTCQHRKVMSNQPTQNISVSFVLYSLRKIVLLKHGFAIPYIIWSNSTLGPHLPCWRIWSDDGDCELYLTHHKWSLISKLPIKQHLQRFMKSTPSYLLKLQEILFLWLWHDLWDHRILFSLCSE